MNARTRRLAESLRRRNPIKDPTSQSVVRTGEATSAIIADEIVRVFGGEPNVDILDFGAASGRVTLPLSKRLPRSRIVGVDVDGEAIEYLRLMAPPNVSAELNGYNPPLRFPERSFDVVFALSVWSHFPEDLSTAWLRELRRVTRPGSVLLISTGGAATLEVWRRESPAWADVTRSDLEDQRFIYRAFRGIEHAHDTFPGIAGEGTWGNTAIHPDYIREEWSLIFDIVEVRPSGVAGGQDLVVMRRW